MHILAGAAPVLWAQTHTTSHTESIYVKRPHELVVILALIVLVALWARSRNTIEIKRGKRDWES